jgi:MFS family permease
MASRPGLTRALSALGHRDYRKFALSLVLTSIAAQLLQTAILWQVYELTGSALALGLTGLARAGPHMVLSLLGGVIADRTNRVRLIQAGQIANGALVLALAVATLTGTVELWQLYVATFLNSAFTAVTQPARTALIPRLIGSGSLVNAVALNATIQQTSQIIGPALGGLALAWIDTGSTYVLNAAAYLGAMTAIVGIRADTSPLPTRDSPWTSFLEGLAVVRRRSVIVSLLVLDLGETIFGSYRALLPIFATALGVGEAGFGLLSAAPGVGSLLGAAFILSLGDMRYKGLYTIFGVLAYCGALALLALSPWFWLGLVASALLGLTNSVQMIPRNSVILTISPDAMRGRVEAFRSMLAGGGPPLGFMLSGTLAAALTAPIALVVGAGACAALVGIVGVTRRELRDPLLGAPHAEEAPAASATSTDGSAVAGS